MSEHATILPAVKTISASLKADAISLSKQSQDLYTDSLQYFPIQRKLSVGAVDDPLEDEADAMADTVMRMPEQNFIQRKYTACEEEERAQRKPLESFIQKKCAHCEEEESAQRKPLSSFIQKKQSSFNNNAVASDSVYSQIQSTKGGGNAMSATTKNFMESRFGADFSNVKIHTGSYASQLSNDLNAQAFTVGSDIYFNKGKYSPESSEGKHLLAHELTHTLQQNDNNLNLKTIIFRKTPKPQTAKPEPDANDLTKAETYITDFFDNEDKITSDLYQNATTAIHLFGIYSKVKEKEKLEPPIATIKFVLGLIPGGKDILEVVEMLEREAAIATEVEKMTKKEDKKTEPDEATAETFGKTVTQYTRQRQVISEQRTVWRNYLELFLVHYSPVNLLQAMQNLLGPIKPYNAEVIIRFGLEYELNLYKEFYVANAWILHERPSMWGNVFYSYEIRDVPDEALKRILELNKQLGHVPKVVIDPRFATERTGLIPGYVEAVKILLDWGVKLKPGLDEKPEQLHTGDDLRSPYKGERFKEVH